MKDQIGKNREQLVKSEIDLKPTPLAGACLGAVLLSESDCDCDCVNIRSKESINLPRCLRPPPNKVKAKPNGIALAINIVLQK